MACRPISANAPPARNGNVAARMVHAAPPALVRIVQKARARREESASAHRRKSVRSRAPRLDNSIVVLIILVGILFALLKANATNSIVSEVHGWGRWLAGPFDGMFSFHSANTALAVNWGIAAVLYLFVGGLIARLIGRTHR